MYCKPHRWNYGERLPIIRGSHPEKHDAIKCLNCGRVLDVMDTSPNMRASIAHSVASKLYGGDEYDEVRASVVDFFTDAIARRR